jgi:hypothetical protein
LFIQKVMSASERWKKKKAGQEEDPQEKKNKVGFLKSRSTKFLIIVPYFPRYTYRSENHIFPSGVGKVTVTPLSTKLRS